MSSIKIGFVKQFASIPPTYGGLSVYVKRLTLTLNKYGYPSGAFYRFGKLEGIPQPLELLFDPMVCHARSFMILPEFYRLYQCCKPYKIIHSHLNFRTVFCMWLIHKLQHKPLVYTVHNQMIEREFVGTNCLDRFCLRSLFKDKKVQFVTVNEKAKLRLESNYKFANEIKVICPYIPPVEIGTPLDYISNELNDFIICHKRYILFYAESFAYDNNNNEIYGTETIIEAFIMLKSTFSDLALVFCMPNMNDKKRLSKLKETIKTAGFESEVYWQVEGISEMWPLIRRGSLYLRPTSTDGDSVLLREALGLGLQSLASDSAIRPKECRVYKYGNMESLIKEAIYMLQNPSVPICESVDNFTSMLDIYKGLLN